ncbi:MAG: M48 family metalloprotease [Planctomycetota bacterium]
MTQTIATGVPAEATAPPTPPMKVACGDGSPVDVKPLVAKGTGFHAAVGYFLAIAGAVVISVISYGIALLVMLVGAVWDFFRRRKAEAILHGSAIKAGPDQFPELYDCLNTFADRLGMSDPPDLYVIEDNTQNAAAVNVGRRKVVLLIDDIVEACLRSGDPRTLAFVIGHELAHHRLGHTGTLRAYVGKIYKRLARLDELSCDTIANELVGDHAISLQALALLLSGPHLAAHTNFDALARQAEEVANNKMSKKAEKTLTHPLLLRRFHRLAHPG